MSAAPASRALLGLALRLYATPQDVAAIRYLLFSIAGDVRRLELALDDIVADAAEAARAMEDARQEAARAMEDARQVGRLRVLEGGRR